MALYWFEMGRKITSPWREKVKEPEAALPSNPYARQQKKIEEQEVKVVYANQLMKKNVLTLPSNTSLNLAFKFLKENKIRHAPVVDSESVKMIGIISDRDIMRKWAGIGDSFFDWISQGENGNLPITQCMTRKVLTAEVGDLIIDVARAMFSEKVGCVPILGKEGQVLGIITRTDILRLVVRTAPAHFWL